MSSRKFINNGDYQLVLDNGRLIVNRPDATQDTSAIEIAYTGSAPSGYIGVTGGAFKYGFDNSVPFDVYHEGRPPRVDEVDFADQPAPENVFYVAENGIDSNDGRTLGSPLRSIKAASIRANRVQAERMEFLMIAGQDETDYNDQYQLFGKGFIVDGGSGYSNSEIITLTNGAEITVDAVDGGGAVTQFTVGANVGTFIIPDFIYGQQSVSAGSGTGFKLRVGVENAQAQKPQRPPVSIFVKAGNYTENNPILVNRKVAVWGDTLRSAFVSPRTKTILMRGNLSGASLAGPNVTAANNLATNRTTIINSVIDTLNPPSSSGLYKQVMDASRTERYRREMDKFITAMIDDLTDGVIERTEIVAFDYYQQILAVYPDERVADTSGSPSPTQFMLSEFVSQVNSATSDAEAVSLAQVFADTLTSPEVPDPANPGSYIVDRVRPATVSVNTDGSGSVNAVNVLDGGYGYRQTPVPDVTLLGVDTAENPGGFDDAARLLRINRTYIKDRIAEYVVHKLDVDNTGVWSGFTLSQENRDLCKRDTGYILDAIIQDLEFGGNEYSIDSAITYRDNVTVLPTNQVDPTVDTFEQIIPLAEKIIRKEEPDPLYTGQNMSGITTSGIAEVPEPQALIIDGIVTDLVDGINNTISEASPVYKLRVVGILDERPGPQNNITPAVIEFDVVNHALVGSPAILEAGANLTVDSSGVTNSQSNVDVSNDIPHPDDSYDLFYVNTGSYFAGMTFNNLSGHASAVAFDPLRRDPLTPSAQKGHITTSPYVQNCSTINLDKEGGIGMKINGKHTRVLRSMVCDSFTQINTAGTGVYLLNRGYAQLVSIFTVSTNIGLRAETGGLCSVANSNSSFGNFGLLGRGVSAELDNGTVNANLIALNDEADFDGVSGNGTFVAGSGYSPADIITLSNNAQITVDTVGGSGEVTAFTIREVGSGISAGTTLTQSSVDPSGGTGFTLTPQSANLKVIVFQTEVDVTGLSRRPAFGDAVLFDVTYSSTSNGAFRTFADLDTIISDDPRVEIIDDNGDIIPKYRYRIANRTPLTVELLDSGTLPVTSVTARLRKYYTVNAATPLDGSGSTTVTLDLGVTQEVANATTVRFYQRSLITTSSHTFEYVGGGTNYLTAIPSAGGTPIRENEIIEDADLGGSVFFTSTDDRGDFRIGPELTINRNTGTITGEAFERSLFAILTPYILSLET